VKLQKRSWEKKSKKSSWNCKRSKK